MATLQLATNNDDITQDNEPFSAKTYLTVASHKFGGNLSANPPYLEGAVVAGVEVDIRFSTNGVLRITPRSPSVVHTPFLLKTVADAIGFNLGGPPQVYILNDNANKAGGPVTATRFVWRDPSTIPPREWIYGNHYIRKYMTATVGAGGSGKSTHALTEVLAMVTGRPLLGEAPAAPCRVWYVNLEDPREEIERRVGATATHFGLDHAALEKGLFIDSGREQGFVVLREDGRETKIVEPVVQSIINEVRKNRIDVLVVDPFISTHEVEENDNSKIHRVAAQWVRIADEAGISVELIHHVRKTKEEVTADDGRGGGALKDKARSVRAINSMSADEAAEAGIDPADRFDYFRIDGSKQNLARRSGHSNWRKMESVGLGNGCGLRTPQDHVGVATAWAWPSTEQAIDDMPAGAFDTIKARIGGGDYRESEQAKSWAGVAVAEILGLDVDDKAVKRRIKRMLKTWTKEGHFRTEMRLDPASRHMKPFVIATPASPPEK